MSSHCIIFLRCAMMMGVSWSLSSPTPISSSAFPTVQTGIEQLPPPIVYTIAGSDSGGGAGIQADLHAIHAMNCHGCSAITCLTAQNSIGVTAVHTPPSSFLSSQLSTLRDDLPPMAIKIGMLGSAEIAKTVGTFLKELLEEESKTKKIWIVLDPVMISTSGHKLIDDDAIQAMMDFVFPYIDILTPNKFEAEAFLDRALSTPQDVEQGAKDLLKRLADKSTTTTAATTTKSVLIKGGHTLIENQQQSFSDSDDNPTIDSSNAKESSDVHATLIYAQDFLLSTATDNRPTADERICDGSRGLWLRTTRWDSQHTHGTGCTLSSAIASALALGEQNRQQSADQREGATSSIGVVDACCLAKAYVSAGIQDGLQLGKGPGPVVHTTFPSLSNHFPLIVVDPIKNVNSHGGHSNDKNVVSAFRPLKAFSSLVSTNSDDDGEVSLGRILPIVDNVEWVERLAQTPGITDIQLRIKDTRDPQVLSDRVKSCQNICSENGVRLWVNDHWEAALEANCFGVHFGQEDVLKCILAGGLDQLMQRNMALGISTHSYGELAVALGMNPSYISLGPVFGTSSKNVAFDPQGPRIVRKWRQLIPKSIPLVTIGGIGDVNTATENRKAGADCIAVIGAVTKSENVAKTVSELNAAMA